MEILLEKLPEYGGLGIAIIILLLVLRKTYGFIDHLEEKHEGKEKELVNEKNGLVDKLVSLTEKDIQVMSELKTSLDKNADATRENGQIIAEMKGVLKSMNGRIS